MWPDAFSAEEMARLAVQVNGSATGTKRHGHKPDAGEFTPTMITRPLAEIEPRAVRSIWRNRIFEGTFGLVAGAPGVGKSQFIGALVTAITRGVAPPGGGDVDDPSDVLLLALEDDPAVVLRPRYEAMGADLSRVHIIDGIRASDDAQLVPFSLAHIELLERKLKEMPSIKTIVIDPIASAMGGVDTFRSNEVRERLDPFLEVTDRLGITVVGVTHTNKATTQHGAFRVEGSLGGFVGRARWVDGVGELEDGTRGIGVLKSNLGPTNVPVVTFSIDATGQFRWIGETDAVEASSLFNPPASEEERDAAEEARAAILSVLSEGSDVEATTLLKRLKDLGHSDRTVQRQRASLRKNRTIERIGGGVAGPVRWRMNPQIAHSSHSSPSHLNGDQCDLLANSGDQSSDSAVPEVRRTLSPGGKLCSGCGTIDRCFDVAGRCVCGSCYASLAPLPAGGVTV